MISKYGKWYADWSDADGRRRRKAFATIAEALLWKELRATERWRHNQASKLRTPQERRAHRKRIAQRSKQKRWLESCWRALIEHHRLAMTKKRLGIEDLEIITEAHLRKPKWKVVDASGKAEIEHFVTAEQLTL